MITVEQVIAKYRELRTVKDAMEADHKAALAPIKGQLEKLESWLMAKAQEDGVSSFKTDAGTAFLTTSESATVADWDTTLTFIREQGAYEFLDKRVNKTAVREYVDVHGTPPPGVNFSSRVSINVRKPAAKISD